MRKLIVNAPSCAGKTFFTSQPGSPLTDGDALLNWPAGRFWEEPDWNPHRFYLKEMSRVLPNLSDNIALFLPASTPAQLSEMIDLLATYQTEMRVVIPQDDDLIRNWKTRMNTPRGATTATLDHTLESAHALEKSVVRLGLPIHRSFHQAVSDL